MQGDAELAKLAELLRLGAQTGRQIASLRPRDAHVIAQLADRAEAMAAELEALATNDGDRPH